MKCSNCGNEISDTAKFCPHCGTATVNNTGTSGTGSIYEESFRRENADFREVARETVSSVPERDVYTGPSYQAPEQKRGLGIAGMVLGLTTLTFCWVIYIALVTGIIGIILSAISRKQGRNGFAKAGLITSIIGLALAIILLFIFGATIMYGVRYYY